MSSLGVTPRSDRPRIAIIDDSRLEAHFVATCLNRDGFDTDQIGPRSLSQIILALHRQVPDLLVLDFFMPFCHGDLIAQTCRSMPDFRDMRIVVHSAHRQEELRDRFKWFDVDAILSKPCSPRSITSSVRKALAAKLPEA